MQIFNFMIVCVTGATGHIGSSLLPLLLDIGTEIRILSPSTREWIPKGVQFYSGSVTDSEIVNSFIKGADVVIHLAGKISIDTKEQPEIYNINVRGTEIITNACIQYNVEKLLHFGTIHSYDPSPRDQPLDESRSLREGGTPYDKSKKQADEIVLQAAKQGLNASILAPTSVFGPPDYRPSLMGQAIRDIYENNIPSLVPGGYNFVDVRDIAEGTIKAIDSSRPGEKYILGGNHIEISDLAKTIGRIGDTKVPTRTLSPGLLYTLLPVFRFQSWISNKPPLLTRDSLDTLLNGNPNILSSKAKRDFDYATRPFEISISDTLDWLKEQKMII